MTLILDGEVKVLPYAAFRMGIGKSKVDKRLVGNAYLFGLRFEVVDGVVINVDGDMHFQNLGVRVLPGIRKIIFCTHNHKPHFR